MRTAADAAGLADAGVARVVMGSAALGRPALVEEVASIVPVAVGLDHRAGVLAVDGWTRPSDVALTEALSGFAGAAAFVITDIERDGTLAGPDVAGLARGHRGDEHTGHRQRRRRDARRPPGARRDRRPRRDHRRPRALRGAVHGG